MISRSAHAEAATRLSLYSSLLSLCTGHVPLGRIDVHLFFPTPVIARHADILDARFRPVRMDLFVKCTAPLVNHCIHHPLLTEYVGSAETAAGYLGTFRNASAPKGSNNFIIIFEAGSIVLENTFFTVLPGFPN